MIIALNGVVAMETAVELTLAYVRERPAFGGRLFDFQNTQFVLADAKTQAVVAREFVDALMVLLLNGQLDATVAAMAKLWVTETAFRQIDACQQLFGGYGYMTEYPIARLFADARAARIYGGANEIMKLVIARSL
jgi:acyl-CoA dehydrogenase